MSLLRHAPAIDLDDVRRIARESYGIDATPAPLSSERDQNVLLTTAGGERFVLKIANALEERGLLEAQNQAIGLVSERASLAGRVIPTLSGESLTTLESTSAARHFARLLTYVPGVSLAHVKRHSAGLLQSLGRVVAEVDNALSDFDHPALHRQFHWDLATGRAMCGAQIGRIEPAALRSTVEQLLSDFDRHVAPILARLRRSAIHNDANDHNVIVGAPRGVMRERIVTGLIDFGDMVHSYSVGSLAVAIAYAVLDKADPLAAAAHIVAGYHAARALQDDEIAVLLALVCLRLCMSACVAADQIAERPGDPYFAVSQAPLRRTLPVLAGIHRRFAEYTFRAACGLEPVRSAHAVTEWIRRHAASAAPVLGHDLRTAKTTMLDLSVGSPLIDGDVRENAEPKLSARITSAMADAGAAIGIGRYGEPRLLYTSPIFTIGAGAAAQQRSVHLGIDLFADAGTPVFAPIDGIVYAFANNPAPLDYGPVIVLEHRADDVLFYTVYGHLTEASIARLTVGKIVKRGEQIATLGGAAINGGWTPHLHFQLVTDLLDRGADFPGVASAPEQAVWRSLSPDPSELLHLADASVAALSATVETTKANRQTRVGRNLSVAYAEPVKIARGWMQYLYDEAGRRYVDAYNNVPHVGHAHPRIVRAAADQMRVLNTNTRYLHDGLAAYAAQLTATLPAPLSVCFFVNSGSEANELALRLARAHTRSRDVIVLDAAYHGITTTLIAISPYKHNGPGGSGPPPWVHAVPLPDTYRGVYRRDNPHAGAKYARFVATVCEDLRRGGHSPSAFIAESCPSVGGQLLLPGGYLADVYRFVRDAGGVCIADEVQTGYGRLGTHFWGFQQQDVVPDIVVLGKPIGNGYPIGAVITTPEIAASFDNGMEFFSTFGGSTVSCAVGMAVLDTVLTEGLQEHARMVGARMLSQLQPLSARHPLVGDVRGSGLFLGVELVRDRDTLEPAAAEASFIVNRLREEGILAGTDGPHHNVIKIRPPMPFNEADGDRLVSTLDAILDEEFSAS